MFRKNLAILFIYTFLYNTIPVIDPINTSPGQWFTPAYSAENEAYRQQKCAEFNIVCEKK
jgi:hypothetical protein